MSFILCRVVHNNNNSKKSISEKCFYGKCFLSPEAGSEDLHHQLSVQLI